MGRWGVSGGIVMRRRAGLLVLCAAVVAVAAGCKPPPSPWRSNLVSINGAGTQAGNSTSVRPVFSPDGTKLAFMSFASDLGPTDTNGTADIYLRDLTTGVTTLLSANAADTQAANGSSSTPVFSPDGTKVAFVSEATDLGPTDANNAADIYVRDLVNGTTTLASVGEEATGIGNAGSGSPAFSPDGTRVAFRSASSLVPEDVPRDGAVGTDIYVRDLSVGSTTLVSITPGGTSGNGDVGSPVFSPDGSKIAFMTTASDLGPTDTNGFEDIYVRDIGAGTTTLVSGNAAGNDAGNGLTIFIPVFSPDGNSIYFHSDANDLVALPDANQGSDIFVRDLQTGTTTLISTNASGTASANSDSRIPILSADGTRLAFASSADDLGPTDTNGQVDVYLWDLPTGVTTLVSAAASGVDSGNSSSRPQSLNRNGTRVAFSSYATNLGPNDSDETTPPDPTADDLGNNDVYVRDLTSGTTTMVSTNAAGTDSANDSSSLAVFSPDGSQLAFETRANDLGFTDLNDGAAGPLPDVYVATLHGADLSLALDADSASVPRNGSLTYHLDVVNSGPDPADDAILGVLLPDGVHVVHTEVSAGTCASPDPEHPNALLCRLGTVPQGAEEDATITVSVDAAVGSTLEAIALTSSPTLDPDSADTVARVEVAVVDATP
jgi:Tol biopolymer transport system component